MVNSAVLISPSLAVLSHNRWTHHRPQSHRTCAVGCGSVRFHRLMWLLLPLFACLWLVHTASWLLRNYHEEISENIVETSDALEKSQDDGRLISPLMNDTVLQNRSIWFVHIGKSGGETIKSVLEIGCRSRRNQKRRQICYQTLPSNRLSDAVIGYTHCFGHAASRRSLPWHQPQSTSQKDNIVNLPKFTSFLYNLRHPVDRVASWYDYVNPHHCRMLTAHSLTAPTRESCHALKMLNEQPDSWIALFFGVCFPTFAAWVESVYNFTVQETTISTPSSSMASSSNVNSESSCQHLAINSLQGRGMKLEEIPLAAHLIANLRANINQFPFKPSEREVLVIRTEHLWDDLKHLDVIVGGTGNSFGVYEGQRITHRSPLPQQQQQPRHASSTESSMVAMTQPSHSIFPSNHKQVGPFCCMLRDELEAYQYLINFASNLSKQQKEDTLQSAVDRCGYHRWEEYRTACDSLLARKPIIPKP